MSFQLVQIGHFSDTCSDLQENFKITGAYLRHLEALNIPVIPSISLIPVSNTVDIGFNLSEAITNPEAPKRTILVGNYAPPDLDRNDKGTVDNVRKDFYAAAVEFAGREIPVVTTLNAYELSYIKPAVKELYVIKSDNGSQFRSLTLAPGKAVEFSDPSARQQLIASGAIKRVDLAEIPEVPDVSHVIHKDNFLNIKVWFSKADQEVLQRAAKDGAKVAIDFLQESIDPHCQVKASGGLTAEPRPTLFNSKVGEIIVAQRSSSFYVDGGNIQQIVELRRDPVRDPVNFSVPLVGQKIRVHAV